jgi:hypothetical protein
MNHLPTITKGDEKARQRERIERERDAQCEVRKKEHLARSITPCKLASQLSRRTARL